MINEDLPTVQNSCTGQKSFGMPTLSDMTISHVAHCSDNKLTNSLFAFLQPIFGAVDKHLPVCLDNIFRDFEWSPKYLFYSAILWILGLSSATSVGHSMLDSNCKNSG